MDEAWRHALSSVVALAFGGLAAILGLWVGRDHARPLGFAFAMTTLISGAVLVGMVQSVLDAREALARQADLDRMVATVTEIAVASGDRDLAALIEAQTGRKVEIPPSVEVTPADGSQE